MYECKYKGCNKVETNMFNKKLDFLMRITKTNNSALAKAVSLSPSYVSKLRSGSRPLPKSETYVNAIINYLSKRIETYEQKSIIQSVIKQPLPDDIVSLTELLLLWLTKDDDNSYQLVNEFMNVFSNGYHKSLKPTNNLITTKIDKNSTIFFGIDGMREAIILFFTHLSHVNTPQTIYLYSDESLEWLIDSNDFLLTWQNMFLKVFEIGHRLVTIHSSHRSSYEMLRVLTAWLPLYVSGAVEVYYCTRMRDDLFYHTLLVSPGIAAITSFTSIEHRTDNVRIYISNMQAVQKLEEDFKYFLNKCRILMNTYTIQNSIEYWQIIAQFSSSVTNSASYTCGLPAITIPKRMMLSFAHRMNKPCPEIFLQFDKGLRKQLENYHLYDHFTLPDIKKVKDGLLHIPLSDMIEETNITYTIEEFRFHIKNIINLIKYYENYHPIISEDLKTNWSMFVKKNTGVIISRSIQPGLHMIQTKLLSPIYWEYLSVRRKKEPIQSRETVLNILENYLSML